MLALLCSLQGWYKVRQHFFLQSDRTHLFYSMHMATVTLNNFIPFNIFVLQFRVLAFPTFNTIPTILYQLQVSHITIWLLSILPQFIHLLLPQKTMSLLGPLLYVLYMLVLMMEVFSGVFSVT